MNIKFNTKAEAFSLFVHGHEITERALLAASTANAIMEREFDSATDYFASVLEEAAREVRSEIANSKKEHNDVND